MNILSIISEKIKNTSTAIAGIFGIIATIGGSVIYVENNYAHAQDVKEVIQNQNIQIRQNLMFQLEYYDNTIKKLELEKSKNEELLKDTRTNSVTRAYTRKPDELKDEITELKLRRDIIRQDLVNSQSRNISK